MYKLDHLSVLYYPILVYSQCSNKEQAYIGVITNRNLLNKSKSRQKEFKKEFYSATCSWSNGKNMSRPLSFSRSLPLSLPPPLSLSVFCFTNRFGLCDNAYCNILYDSLLLIYQSIPFFKNSMIFFVNL